MVRPIAVGMSVCRRRLFAESLAWLLIVAFATQSPLSASEVTQAYAGEEKQSCGPRAVYVLAQLMGCDLTYESVRAEIHIGDKGCSIEDIKRSLIKHGVQCAVRRLDTTQLFSLPPPFIAHLRPQDSRTGHFIIVNRVSVKGVEVFDPLVNRDKLWEWRSFSDWSTGYYVVPAPSLTLRGTGPVVLALGFHVLTLALLLVSIRRPLWSRSRTTGRSPRLVTAILVLVMSGAFATSVGAADEIIRSTSNDGKNAASLLGGLCGAKIQPRHATGGEAFDTLDKVQFLLSSHGVPTSVRRVNYGDLMHSTGPCLVPMKFGKSDRARFHVLIKADSGMVITVDAGPMVVCTFTVDEFRRYWSGHALIPIRGDSRIASLAAAGALILPAFAYAIGRRVKHSRMRAPP